jgi:cell division protein FtsI (penicillin-binding protein 3)
MGLRDALNNLENKGIQVKVKGRGKVKSQSPLAGTAIHNNMVVEIILDPKGPETEMTVKQNEKR